MKISSRSFAGIVTTILAFCVSISVQGNTNTNTDGVMLSTTQEAVKAESVDMAEILSSSPIVPAQSLPDAGRDSWGWIDREPVEMEEGQPWWEDRVEIGTRITKYELTDTERNTFLGSINELKEDQNYNPIKFYADVWPVKWVGVGVSYETISAETWTTGESGQEGYSDGTFTVDGPILSLLVALPNRTRFTPFAEVGKMFMSSSVDVNSDWANAHGIQDYQSFEITDEEGGDVWGIGCSIQLTRNIEMDVIYRQIEASVKVDHVLLGHIQQQNCEFPLDSDWFGAGVKYRF